jgi:hypothetical protein
METLANCCGLGWVGSTNIALDDACFLLNIYLVTISWDDSFLQEITFDNKREEPMMASPRSKFRFVKCDILCFLNMRY